VSGGSIDRYVSEIVTGSQWPAAHNAAAAAVLRRTVERPVLVVGRIHDPRVAERVLRGGQADLVVMGRALLADPELPAKARAGRLADVRPCISCQHCIDSLERLELRCAVNPRAGREEETPLAPARVRRRVVVAGAGCAGLEAARLLALRGHEVVLVERERRLGGSLFWAAVAHPANEPFLRFLVRQVRRLGVELRLGEELTPEGALRLRAEVAVVATGARLGVPELPGDGLPHVFTGPALRALLGAGSGREPQRGSAAWRLAVRALGRAGASLAPAQVRALVRHALPFGHRVAVVGGDLAALELAEWLAGTGREVTLLVEGDELAPEVGAKRRAEHLERVDRLGISVHTASEVCEITPTGCRVRPRDAAVRPVAADAVVLAGTPHADLGLSEALSAVLPEVHAIGDCTGLGLIAGATRDALRVACTV
jgi:2,4-dienoyl-CoA reductase (NADPH2)